MRLTATTRNFNWIVGANYSHDQTYELNSTFKPYSTGTLATLPFGRIDRVGQLLNQKFDTIAVFGNADYRITQTLTAHAGARYTQANLDYSGCANGDAAAVASFAGLYNFLRARAGQGPISIAPGGCVTINAATVPGLARGTLDENNVSWRAGLDWEPVNRMLLYANVSRGYKAGSAPTLPGLRVEQYAPVTQESVTAYEAGFKFGLLDRTVPLNYAVFHYDYKDKQLRGRAFVTPNLFGALEALVNVPKSHITGVEAQAAWTPSSRFTANVGATYIRSQVDGSYSNYTILGTLADFGGESFPYTPKWQVVGDAEYRHPVGTMNAFVGGGFNYHSRTTGGFGPSALLAIDPYTTIDARAGLASEQDGWRLTLYAKNLTDEYYWTNVAKLSDAVRRLAGQPRTYGVRFSFDY